MRAWYSQSVEHFLATPANGIIDVLTERQEQSFALLAAQQLVSWRDSVAHLQRTLVTLAGLDCAAESWHVVLEYELSRLGKRIDCILLTERHVLVIEFKRGDAMLSRAACRQAEDYAFSLRHFHEGSHGRPVIPIAIGDFHDRNPIDPVGWQSAVTGWDDAASLLASICGIAPSAPPLDHVAWLESQYRATPTILEAARALYRANTVRALSLSKASEEEIDRTTHAVLEEVRRAREERAHTVVFVTGVPGAGKTLVGLNVVQQVRGELPDLSDPAVMLSGNGPLVKILREALLRDARAQRRLAGGRTVPRGEKDRIHSFIQEMHRFTSDNASSDRPPAEHVVIFDEAQRAWTRAKCDEYARKNRKPSRGLSEPDTVLDIMGRHDWSVLVCLVGPGQEIHGGEGGIVCWHDALSRAPNWRVVCSPTFLSGVSDDSGNRAILSADLHLRTSRRSPLAERLTEWVDAVLDGDGGRAASIAADIVPFPVTICRHVVGLRAALRSGSTGLQRKGVLASSGAGRLRAAGFEPPAYAYTRNVVRPIEWFLRPEGDVQSSNQLEVAMSEFESQGLELDLTGICWGGDFVVSTRLKRWRAQRYTGGKWKSISEEDPEFGFVRNKYRVLLTRARLATTIMVPTADPSDSSQLGSSMDATYHFLIGCGAKTLAVPA